MQKNIYQWVSYYQSTHIKPPVFQGRCFDLLAEEDNKYHLKSFMYNMPIDLCNVLINNLSYILNINAKHLMWGKTTTDKWKHCHNMEATARALVHVETWHHPHPCIFMKLLSLLLKLWSKWVYQILTMETLQFPLDAIWHQCQIPYNHIINCFCGN